MDYVWCVYIQSPVIRINLPFFPFHSLLHPPSFYATTFLCNLLRLCSRRTIYNAIHLGDTKEKKRKKENKKRECTKYQRSKDVICFKKLHGDGKLGTLHTDSRNWIEL